MKYQRLGSTDITVSKIGFGASPLGGVFGVAEPDEGRRAVHRALDRGINFFDVSPYYGLTLAEERLGFSLLGHRGEIILATKCGRYGIDQFDFSADHITREFENSLRRLKTDYIDLLQVHDVEFGSIEQIIHETIPALRLLQEQGKVRFIGITGYWPDLLASIAKSTAVDTVLNYCHFNLLMNDMDQTLTPTARRLGIGLLNASPLHMGLLGGCSGPSWHPAPSSVQAIARKIVKLCESYSVSAPAFALNACIEHEVVASTFIGLSNAAQVDDALQALEFEPPLELRHAIAPLIASVLNTTWSSGRPENQPAEVHAI